MDLKPPPLWLLTGPIGAGKTTFCRQLAQAARQRGWQVAGLLSPAQMEGDQKIGILLKDLHSGEQQRLAYTTPTPNADVHLGRWYFDVQVLEWGNRVLKDCSPCDLLVIDELGPLEFNAGKGLSAAFKLLAAGQYRVGCVVIRPLLLEAASASWPWAEVLPMEQASIYNFL
jgi:nucleoside-triphosphatase THEP1